MKQNLRPITILLPDKMADRLVKECGSTYVNAYVQGLLEEASNRLDLALQRLKDGRVTESELVELFIAYQAVRPPRMSQLEAAAIVVTARNLGRQETALGWSQNDGDDDSEVRPDLLKRVARVLQEATKNGEALSKKQIRLVVKVRRETVAEVLDVLQNDGLVVVNSRGKWAWKTSDEPVETPDEPVETPDLPSNP